VSVAVLVPNLVEAEKFESSARKSVVVILPTYCEAENIESLIREIQGLKLNVSIVVVDDSSPDGTPDMVNKLSEEYGNIVLISRPEKLGLGTAITDGFRYILSLREKPDYVVTMDSDYSHNPQDIPRLVGTARNGYSLVIGSRYVEGGAMRNWPLRRRLISRFANLLVTIMVGVRLHDCTSGFRCYSQQYIVNVLSRLHSQTYEIQIETIRQARLNDFAVKEIPIIFVDRKKGKSKLTTVEFVGFVNYVSKVTFAKVKLSLVRFLNELKQHTA
jgi:dolichol-phosphate mannosyltransferase